MSDWPSDAWQPPAASPPAAPPWSAAQPGWGQPGYPPGGYGGATRTNGLAIAALVAGCAQFVFCGIGTILAIVFGHIARGQIKRSNGTETGSGLATAGLVLGYIGLALIVLGTAVILVVVLAFSDDIEESEMRRDARDFIESVQREAFLTQTDARDADLLRSAYFAEDLDFEHDAYLADGSSILTATNEDWERNGWRFELFNDTPAGDAYVCATVPEDVGAPARVTNGPCLP